MSPKRDCTFERVDILTFSTKPSKSTARTRGTEPALAALAVPTVTFAHYDRERLSTAKRLRLCATAGLSWRFACHSLSRSPPAYPSRAHGYRMRHSTASAYGCGRVVESYIYTSKVCSIYRCCAMLQSLRWCRHRCWRAVALQLLILTSPTAHCTKQLLRCCCTAVLCCSTAVVASAEALLMYRCGSAVVLLKLGRAAEVLLL